MADPASALFGCTMKMQFESVSCDKVLKLASSRANGEGGWVDPHNRGTYKVTSSAADKLEGTRVTGSRGGKDIGGPFTDTWSFKTASTAEPGYVGGFWDGCAVTASSTSTGFSFSDASTNYCNIHNLFANSDLKFVETFDFCLEHDVKACGKI